MTIQTLLFSTKHTHARTKENCFLPCPVIIGESVSQTREVHIILTQSHLKPNYNEHFASKMDFYKPGEVVI